jgi:hypothetical protein
MFTRLLWGMSTIVVLVFGALGLLVLSVGALIVWSALGLVVGVAVWRYVSRRSSARQWTGVTRSDWAVAALAAVGVVVGCLVSAGMVAAMGAVETAGVLLMVVAGCAGWLLWLGPTSVNGPSRVKRGSSSAAPVSPPPIAASPPVVAARDLSTGALCLAWRRSFVELQRAADESARQRVVRLRTEYLDELERRDRAGFARWLGSGARAGSDPQRYLTASG